MTYRAILVVPLPQRDRREAQQLVSSMHVLHVYYDKKMSKDHTSVTYQDTQILSDKNKYRLSASQHMSDLASS